jgi:hypothetical protein
MKQLIRYVNGQVEAGNFQTVDEACQFIAKELGLRHGSSIKLWAYSGMEIPARHASGLHRLTGVGKHILCPKIFDAPVA